MTKFLYWINNKHGGLGSFNSVFQAQNAISEIVKVNTLYTAKNDWKVVKHEAVKCPTCQRWAEKHIVDDIGECLRCEKLRGEVQEA